MRQLLLVLGALGTLHASTVSMEIASPGNIFVGQENVIAGGVYIGPYTLEVNGATSLGLCVDYAHWSEVGAPWNAFETPIAATGMNNTYLFQSNAGNPNVDAIVFRAYEQEAFLYRQIVSALLPGDRIAMQQAAWSITDSSFSISNNPEAQLWAAVARDPVNYQHVDLTGIFILSDVKGFKHGAQEFIDDPIDSVPEPPSLGVFAGLLGLGLAWFRRRRRSGYDAVA